MLNIKYNWNKNIDGKNNLSWKFYENISVTYNNEKRDRKVPSS